MKWKTVRSGTTETLTSITVDREHRIWIGGAKGALLSADDDGRSFRSHPNDVQHGFTGLCCTDGARLVALSGGVIIAADRGAKPFEFLPTTCRSRHLYGFRGVTHTVYATGRRGAVVRSLDGGARWKSLKTQCKSFLYSIGASTDGKVICAGGDSVVTHSIDAGVTWRTITLGYRRYVRGVVVLDNGDVTVVADGGRMSRIDTAGGSRDLASGTDADLYAVCADKRGLTVAVGKGVLLWGRDAEWTVESVPGASFVDVCATPAGRFVTVGSGGMILVT